MRAFSGFILSLLFAVLAVRPAPALAEGGGTTAVEHHGLQVDLPGKWRQTKSPEDVLLVTSAAEPSVLLTLLPSVRREKALRDDYEAIFTSLGKAHRILSVYPPEPRSIWAENAVYQRRDLEVDGTVVTFYLYGLHDDDSIHVMALVGAAESRVNEVHEALQSALRSARLEGAPATRAELQPQHATQRTSSWPAPNAKAVKGGRVLFSIRAAKQLSVVGPKYLLVAGAAEDSFVSHTGEDSVAKSPEARGVYRLRGAERTLLIGNGDADELLGFNTTGFDRLWTDSAGTVYAAVRGGKDRVPVAGLIARTRAGDIEPVVDLPLLRALGDGSNWGTQATFAVTPEGGVWSFVKQGQGKLRGAYLQPGGRGPSGATELQSISSLANHHPGDLAHGSADPFGGYVFWSEGELWRITREAPPVLLARVKMPADDGTLVTAPVVTPDGHIWIGMYATSAVMQWLEPHDATHMRLKTTGFRSGSSGLVRMTPDGKGGAAVAVVSGREIAQALATAGHSDGARLELRQLQVDPTTGELIAWDAYSETLFRLQVKSDAPPVTKAGGKKR